MGQLNTEAGTYPIIDPSWTGVYFHALVDSPGTVAANQYLSVFNPVASGKIIIALGLTAGSYSGGTVTGPTSMRAGRITSSTGGTQIVASAVNRFSTAMANPVSIVRIGNPTVVSAGTPLIGITPVIGPGANVGAVVIPPPGPAFAALPGEGISFSVPVGDVNQFWNLQFIWAEKPI